MGQWSYAARKARARALGYDTPYQLGKANTGERAAARVRLGDTAGLKRQAAAENQAAAARAAARDAVTPLRNGELTSSHLSRVLLAAVNRAVTADRFLSAVVTVRVEGGGYRDVRLWQGSHRYRAELFRDDIREFGGVKPAFFYHVQHAMTAAKYPDDPVAIEHVDLTAAD